MFWFQTDVKTLEERVREFLNVGLIGLLRCRGIYNGVSVLREVRGGGRFLKPVLGWGSPEQRRSKLRATRGGCSFSARRGSCLSGGTCGCGLERPDFRTCRVVFHLMVVSYRWVSLKKLLSAGFEFNCHFSAEIDSFIDGWCQSLMWFSDIWLLTTYRKISLK